MATGSPLVSCFIRIDTWGGDAKGYTIPSKHSAPRPTGTDGDKNV